MTAARDIVRSHSIGASMIAQICGLSRFGGPWEVWARSHGIIDPPEVTDEMWWGTELEPFVARGFERRTGLAVEWSNERVYSKTRPWQHATPDAYVLTQPRAILECKTANLSRAGDWGSSAGGPNDVPDEYVAQVQWQMDVCELNLAYIAVLIGVSDFRWYLIPRDEEFLKMLLDDGERFFQSNILGGVEPPMEASLEARRYIRRRYPHERQKLRQATLREIAWLTEYADVRTKVDELEKRKTELENDLTRAVGDHEGLTWRGGKFTWKKTKDSAATDWEELARGQLEGYAEDEQKEMIAAHTHPIPGYRRIHFSPKKELHA